MDDEVVGPIEQIVRNLVMDATWDKEIQKEVWGYYLDDPLEKRND